MKSGCPKYAIGPAQIKKFISNISKTKRFSSIKGHPQDVWMLIWLKASRGVKLEGVNLIGWKTGSVHCLDNLAHCNFFKKW